VLCGRDVPVTGLLESFVVWPSVRLCFGEQLLCDSQCAGVVVLPSRAIENLLALVCA
jgi:hypothetical protein